MQADGTGLWGNPGRPKCTQGGDSGVHTKMGAGFTMHGASGLAALRDMCVFLWI
jgi:hypothetical protein